MSVAVVNLGGKQFTVTPGKIIDVPHVDKSVGDTVELSDMLGGGKVSATVLEQAKGDKLRVVKFKNKTRYIRTIGHRSLITRLKIDSIAG